MKKQWQAPALEVLHVRETMLGFGTTIKDFVYVDGKIVDSDDYDS